MGGSENFHGAPVLASNAAYSVLAALRVGTGYATAFVPKSILTPSRILSSDIIVRSLSGNNINMNDFPTLSKAVDSSECLVIGNGLGREKESLRCASKIISYAIKKSKNIVIDADAIHAVKKHLKKLSKNAAITPNQREFEILFKKHLDPKNTKARIEAAVTVSKQLNCIVLLKGHDTIVTDGKIVKRIKSKTAALATMGTGDVLAGIIGGFATNNSMFLSAVAGAYLHATIGDKIYKEKGNHILASDVVDYIPKILKKFDRNY